MNGQLYDGQQAGESNDLLHTGLLESSAGRASNALHLFYKHSLLQLAVTGTLGVLQKLVAMHLLKVDEADALLAVMVAPTCAR